MATHKSSIHFGFLKEGKFIVSSSAVDKQEGEGGTRRDFLYVATASFGAVGAAGVVWPLVDQMNPDRSVLALASTEVDLSPIEEGQAVTVTWRGKPVFIRNRSAEEIEKAQTVDLSELRDPQTDAERTKEGHENWLVQLGVCTHLGCVPLGQNPSDSKGEYDGWFCPCHGSHYDTSGRIRKGPAPSNLEIPPFAFLNDETIKIG